MWKYNIDYTRRCETLQPGMQITINNANIDNPVWESSVVLRIIKYKLFRCSSIWISIPQYCPGIFPIRIKETKCRECIYYNKDDNNEQMEVP